MDKLQSAFVGGWVDPEENSDIPFFSPKATPVNKDVTVVVKEQSSIIPSWTTNLSIPVSRQNILPLLTKDSPQIEKQTEGNFKPQSNPAGWTSGIPNKMLSKRADGVVTYSPFKR